MVLISTFSASNRSSLPSSSTLSTSRLSRCCSPSPPPPFHLQKAATARSSAQGNEWTGSPRNRLDRTACCARRGRGKAGRGALEQQLRRWRGREADRLCGAEKRRMAPTHTLISVLGSPRVPWNRPGGERTCGRPLAGPLLPQQHVHPRSFVCPTLSSAGKIR
jgi:hypothetical protein